MWVSGLLLVKLSVSIIYQGLIAYNFPYKIFVSNILLAYVLDATLNVNFQFCQNKLRYQSTFISIILLANLVILHSLSGKISESQMCSFYVPKITISILIWLSFYGYVFSEAWTMLHSHLISNDYSPDSFGLKIVEVRKASKDLKEADVNLIFLQNFYLITLAI